jgi:serine protease Do
MAEALNVPPPGGMLVKQVAKGSVSERIGLKGGDRVALVEGKEIVVGGDVLLSVQGIPMSNSEDRTKVIKALEDLKVGDDLWVTVFRDSKVVELRMKFKGF